MMMNDLAQKWLNLVCQMLPKVSLAILVLHDETEPVASWPDNKVKPASVKTPDQSVDRAALLSTVVLAKQQQAPVLIDKSDQRKLLIAHPLRIGSASVDFGVLALILEAGANEKQVINRLLDWSCAWLDLLMQRSQSSSFAVVGPYSENKSTPATSGNGLVTLITQLLNLDVTKKDTTILVSIISDYFSAQRAYLAMFKGEVLKLEAISHEASFDSKVNLVGLVEAAMYEAIDQGGNVHFDIQNPQDLIAHEQLLGEVAANCCLTIVLYANEAPIGALLMELDSPGSLSESERESERESEPEKNELLGSLLGSVLVLRRESQRGIANRAKRHALDAIAKVVGPERPVSKFLSLILISVFVFSFAVEGTYEVIASATLEGKTQQAIVAPFDGFIVSAQARAGDRVAEGQVLARMEDKDLLLEMQKVDGEKEAINRQYRQALSDLNQSEVRILRAQLSQIAAREELLAYQLIRISLTTPVAGIVLTGDLSRSIGAPVEKGQMLFEIAPLQSYRIVLMIEESDISDIEPGMSGVVLLASHPGLEIPFVIEHISSVLTSAETQGVVFRTEGVVSGDFDVLRPGMEGLARVSIDQRSFAWIWFHQLVDWWRIKLWQYGP